MKLRSTLCVVSFFTLLFFVACMQYGDIRPTNQALWGAWNWQSSSGGTTGKQSITPETAGYTKQIRFTPEGEYRELHNGKVAITARYTVEMKKTIFGPHEVIVFADTTGQLGDKVIMRVTATSLQLSDPFPDGFYHVYVHVEE